ncbi:monooxygenase [Allorhizocola rhizosphaerae]|uniref:monooxygenase n=1 Tax=Allorhizocola rhizosphaerae TaxID=1872709 RepID=UPI000E3D8E40|nr:monooxygenase [Allorhizocola rhizosphaerae]
MTLARAIASILAVAFVSACSTPAAAPLPEPANHTGHGSGQASIPPPQPLRDGERFLELSLPQPFTPAPARGTDEYRCFLIDPGLTAPTFITGSQFLPDNAAIVHHAILFRVPAADVAEARELDAKADGGGWTCFGGTGITSDQPLRQVSGGAAAWIGAWAPGGDEVLLAQNVGYEMAAGSQIVLQVHYNTLGAKGADRSGIRLRLRDSGDARLKPLHTKLLPAPVELPCAEGESGRLCDRQQAILDVNARFGAQAGLAVSGLSLLCDKGQPKPGPVQSCTTPVREAGLIHAVAGHMHLLGRSIKVELNPGTKKSKILLEVPEYNFDDQGAHPLPEPVTVKPGDTLRVTCTHDAGLRKRLPALQSLEPRYVVWGDGTADEMCLGVVSWTRT